MGSDDLSRLRQEVDAALPPDLPRRDVVLETGSRYLARVLAGTGRVNLTAITDPREMAVKHLLDCVAPFSRFVAFDTILDLGSGAGLPGIPLALVFPRKSILLAESVRKKAAFLASTVQALELPNVEVVAERGETVLASRPVDAVVTRAAGATVKILRLLEPVRSRFGRVVLYKGPNAETEMAAAAVLAERLGLRGELTFRYDLPEGMGTRCLLEYSRPSRLPVR